MIDAPVSGLRRWAITFSVMMVTVTTTADAVNGDVSSPATLAASPGPDGISLREAIDAANNAPGPHTIAFAPGLAGQTIAITSPLVVTRDGVTLTELVGPDGQPRLTLDGFGITADICSRALLFVYASELTMSRFRIVRVTNHAIRIQAGETFCPPTPPTREVRNVRIEDDAFDNTGISDALDSAIRVWTDPAAAASDATIANVRIVRNTFRAYADGGLIVNANGTNCVIRDLLIQDNTFVDTPFQLELAWPAPPSTRSSSWRA